MILDNSVALLVSQLTKKQVCILMWVFRKHLYERLFYSTSSICFKEHVEQQMLLRSITKEDVVHCLFYGEYGGNLERGIRRNEFKFRIVGKGKDGEPICVAVSVEVTDKLCYDNWIFNIITTFMDNKEKAESYNSAFSLYKITLDFFDFVFFKIYSVNMNNQILTLGEVLENVCLQNNSVGNRKTNIVLESLKITPAAIEEMFSCESMKNEKSNENSFTLLAFNNARLLKETTVCGCFYCCEIYSPSEIKEWVKEKNAVDAVTAVCPKCGIDAVLPEHSSGVAKLSVEILRRLNSQKF